MAQFFDDAVRRPLLTIVPVWVLPNHLTIARALLVVPLIEVRNIPGLAIACVALSSLCDLLDGPLARIRGQASQNGAMLDMASDKVFILGAMIFACSGRIALPIVITVAALECLLAAIRPLKRHRGVKTDANAYGAAKVWLQTIGTGLVLSGSEWANGFSIPVFLAAILFAALSFGGHVRDFFRT